MNASQIIRKIDPTECPHCKKAIFVSYQAMIPAVMLISTMEDIKEAKKQIIGRLGVVKFKDEKEKKNTMDWLKNENTLLDKSDIESIVTQITKNQLELISSANKKEAKQDAKKDEKSDKNSN